MGEAEYRSARLTGAVLQGQQSFYIGFHFAMTSGINEKPPRPMAEGRAASVPEGYRSGIITAITVLLGFSLSFLRYWGFEAAGDWTLRSVISTGMLVLAIALQIFALFRSLRIEDTEAAEYRKTVTWFTASAVALLLGLLLAGLEYSGTASP
jgi:hypothetical protein